MTIERIIGLNVPTPEILQRLKASVAAVAVRKVLPDARI